MTEARSIEEIRASARKTLTDGIASLEACAASPAGLDTILAWPYGLAVMMKEGIPHAVGIERADAINKAKGFAYPVVLNGHHQTAEPRMRRDMARKQIEALRSLLGDLGA